MAKQYDTRNLKKQVEEMNQFEELSKYINSVLDNFKDLSKVDKNDIYELYYIKKVISTNLSKGIVNSEIERNLTDILSRIDLIIVSISDSDIDEIMEREVKEQGLVNINKAKYGDKNQFKGLEDLSKKETLYKSPIREYIKLAGSKKLIMITTFMIVYFMSLSLPTILTDNQDSPTAIVSEVDTKIDTEDITLFDTLSTSEVEANQELAHEMANKAISTLSLITQFIATIGITISSLTLLLDIVKVVFGGIPMFDAVFGDRAKGFFSDDANFVSNLDNLMHISNRQVNANNRLDTAKTLLTNLIAEYPNYTMDAEEFNYLLDARNIKDRIDKNKGRELIIACVDAEYLHHEVHERYERFHNSLRDYTYKNTDKLYRNLKKSTLAVNIDDVNLTVPEKEFPNY